MALRDWLTRDLSPKEDKADVVFMPKEEKERLRLRLISASDGMIDGLATCLQQAQLIDRAREQLFSMLDSVEIGSISQRVGNSSSCGTDNVKRIIDTEISHLFKASLYRTATELVPVFIWAANIDMINKDLEDAEEKIRAGRKASMETYAVIGAMATTGGDAEEAARLLGVTVDFINERF
jgi:hypothetical protein